MGFPEGKLLSQGEEVEIFQTANNTTRMDYPEDKLLSQGEEVEIIIFMRFAVVLFCFYKNAIYLRLPLNIFISKLF